MSFGLASPSEYNANFTPAFARAAGVPGARSRKRRSRKVCSASGSRIFRALRPFQIHQHWNFACGQRRGHFVALLPAIQNGAHLPFVRKAHRAQNLNRIVRRQQHDFIASAARDSAHIPCGRTAPARFSSDVRLINRLGLRVPRCVVEHLAHVSDRPHQRIRKTEESADRLERNRHRRSRCAPR